MEDSDTLSNVRIVLDNADDFCESVMFSAMIRNMISKTNDIQDVRYQAD